MNGLWKTWSEVKHSCKNKKVVLFGRSDDWVHKTLPELNKQNVAYIIDNNKEYSNQEYLGLKIFSPEVLLEENKDEIFIVITASPYESVSNELNGYGFKVGTHYTATPVFRDWGLLQEMRKYEKEVLISCPDYQSQEKKRFSKLGGGLFVMNTATHEYKKVLDGVTRQMARAGDEIYLVEHEQNEVLHVSLKDYSIIHKYDVNEIFCGIGYYEREDVIIAANVVTDVLYFYDRETFKLLNKVPFSDKSKYGGSGLHHVNDICVANDSLFVSYFSKSGNWKIGIEDAGIDEFNLQDLSRPSETVMRGLWKPHSVEFINDELCFCDSMTGQLFKGNHKVIGKFPGFARGLDYDGHYYYVGQSEVMYSSELLGHSDNIMSSAGFYMFDQTSKMSRFHSIPFIMNVHDLIVL